MKYICQICGYVYDEEAEGVPFSSLPDDWTCPMCRAPKSMFKAEDEEKPENTEQREIIEDDLESLSPGVLAALFSNLARGSEKQYKERMQNYSGRLQNISQPPPLTQKMLI